MAVITMGLRNLQRQLDQAFPNRHKPDGWIGDRAHRQRTSGHNPDDTVGSRPAWSHDPDTLAEVRALDVAADLGPGIDSQDLVDHLIRLPRLGTVVRYIIHRGRIYHARNGFAAEDYDGDNPHTHHIHIEGAWSQAADNNETFNFRLEEIPVALTAADKSWIAAEIARQIKQHTGPSVWNHTEPDPTDPKVQRRTGGDMRSIERRAAERHAEVLAAIRRQNAA